MGTVVKNIETGTLYGISALLSLPFKLVSVCVSLVFGLIDKTFSRFGRVCYDALQCTAGFSEILLTNILLSLRNRSKSFTAALFNFVYGSICNLLNNSALLAERSTSIVKSSVQSFFAVLSIWFHSSI